MLKIQPDNSGVSNEDLQKLGLKSSPGNKFLTQPLFTWPSLESRKSLDREDTPLDRVVENPHCVAEGAVPKAAGVELCHD